MEKRRNERNESGQKLTRTWTRIKWWEADDQQPNNEWQRLNDTYAAYAVNRYRHNIYNYI